MAKKSKDIVLPADDSQDFAELRPHYIPTGLYHLDHTVIKRGGIPTKRITEIWGDEATGKSLLLYKMIGKIQEQSDLPFLLVDTEFTFDPEWAASHGVNLKKLIVKQTNIAEEVFDDVIIPQLRKGGICGIAIDSLGMIDSHSNNQGKRYEIDKEGKVKSDSPGNFARMIGSYTKVIVGPISRLDIPFLIVNQVREGIGMYTAPLSVPGGKVYKHGRTLSLQLKRISDIIVNNEVEGIIVRVVAGKSKIAAKASTTADTDLRIYFVNGDKKERVFSVLAKAIDRGVIVKKAAWYKCDDLDKKWNGEAKILESLLNDDDLVDAVEKLADAIEGDVNTLPDELDDESTTIAGSDGLSGSEEDQP